MSQATDNSQPSPSVVKVKPSLQLFNEVIKRGTASAFGILALMTILVLANRGELVKANVFAAFSLAGAFVLNLVRIGFCKIALRKGDLTEIPSNGFRIAYALMAVGSGACVSALSILTCAHYGFANAQTILALVILAGIGAAGGSSLGAALWTARVFLFVTLFIPSISFTIIDSTNGLPLSIAGGLMTIFLNLNLTQYNARLRELFSQRELITKERTLLRHILDSMPANVSLLNSELRYLMLNEPLLRMIQKNERELLNKRIGSANGPSEFVRLVEDLSTSTRNELNTRLLMRTAQGERWHLLSIRRMRDTGNFVCVSIDIHHELELEAENELAQTKLIQSAKMASLGEMASGISHEINNPLSIIIGRIEMALDLLQEAADPDVPEKIKTHLEKVHGTAHRIAKIVRGLRTFSRHADNDPFVETPVDQIIEDALELCRERLKTQGIRIQVLAEAHGVLSCRPSQISQVLLNLLNNAHDAISGTSNPWIELRITQDENALVLTVTDSGLGIPPDVAAKLMQPFFTTKELGKGTGLGLSISSGIVADHGGTLSYVPHHPNTRFEIRLPRKATSQAAA